MKKIKELNGQQFIDDLKTIREAMAYTSANESFFKIRKLDILQLAEKQKIHYIMTNEIFVNKRNVMVLL